HNGVKSGAENTGEPQ
ncbi:MAG: hypothetical protein ACU0CO_15055, partial [Shimia sp.]